MRRPPAYFTVSVYIVYVSFYPFWICCMGYSGAGERTPLFVYNREFLLSRRAFPTDITFPYLIVMSVLNALKPKHPRFVNELEKEV